MRIFKNTNIDFLGKRKIWYIVSITIIIIGIISGLVKGINYGIDFLGGTEVVVSFDRQIDIGTIRSASANWGIGNVELKTFGTVANNIIIRTALQDLNQQQFDKLKNAAEAELKKAFGDTAFSIVEKTPNTIVYRFADNEMATKAADLLYSKGYHSNLFSKEPSNQDIIVRLGVADLITEGIRNSFPDVKFEIIKSDQVGPKIGAELRLNAVLAIVFALIAIMLYIGLRFKFIFGVGALLSLAHDVFIVFAFVSVFDGLFPGLNLEFNQQMIAAFLTLVGFSVNDTVVIFDRIRENLKIHKTMDIKELINMSINRTLSRTVLTSGTVAMVVLVLLFFGGEVNQGFAFAFLIGVITGTYSSIYVASSVVYDFSLRTKKKIQF